MLSYKSDKEGLIAKTKARLLTKGFMHRVGTDYLQTFAPTPVAASAKIVTVVANDLKYRRTTY